MHYRLKIPTAYVHAVLIFGFLEAVVAQLQSEDAQPSQPFVIRVVDEQTGRGVPLVELRTTASSRYYTDSQGIVAFWEPGWMNRRVFFYVSSDGYRLEPDGFGFEGRTLLTTPGQQATIRLKRTMIAERLYRVTGAGIYRDSVLAEKPVPIRHPILNAGVIGSDSVVNAVYKGKLYWFWGDTNRMEYPLGNFHVPGAVSRLPSEGGLDPYVGVDLEYFVEGDSGFAKETAHMPGDGPTWINGLVVVDGGDGTEAMVAGYVKVKPPLDVYQHGLCRWDEEQQRFLPVVIFPQDAPIYPTGHPWVATDGSEQYVYFTDPLAITRCPATLKAMADVTQYEAYTCMPEGTVVASTGPLPAPDRSADGTISYRWRRGTSPVRPELQQRLIRAGHLKPHEGLIQLRDRDTAKPVLIHSGGVAWNAFRRRWISVFVQQFGETMLGEVWYAEADAPWGPWVYAVKVASHQRYSFYNPKLHPYFDQQGGRRVFFEGTYAHTFSGNPEPRPWYDYNQLMYCLWLEDPRLALPVAFYNVEDDSKLPRPWPSAPPTQLERAPRFEEFRKIDFFAWDRPVPSSVALRQDAEGRFFTTPDVSERDPDTVYLLAAEVSDRPPATVGLYALTIHGGGERLVVARTAPKSTQARLLGWVWPSPYRSDITE
jgi:hypothetical protein